MKLLLLIGIGLNLSSTFSIVALSQTHAFTNVHVIPMDSFRILHHQTVIITDGKIAAIGNTREVSIPKEASIIDGKGQYLIPGLIDCYAHIHEKNLMLFLANGITTVRNVPGAAFQHAIKKLSDTGKLQGPRIYSTGPAVTGSVVAYHTQGMLLNADEARFAVRDVKRMGYQSVFSYVTITPDIYSAVLDEARQQGLPVQGHVPYMIPFEEYAEGSQLSFDNLVGLLNPRSGDTYPKEQLIQFAEAFRKNGKYVIPTLTIHKARSLAHKSDSLKLRAEMDYVPPRQRVYWHLNSLNYRYSGASEVVKVFYENGVKLLIGSDAGFHFAIHGFSYLEEVQNFAELGIPHYDILKSGTSSAAEFLGWDDKIGTVSIGKEADLLLVPENPLEKITTLAHHNGVMSRGVWYSRSKLNESLQSLKNELRGMPGSDRFGGFSVPDKNYHLLAHYAISYKDIRCGDEKIFSSINSKNQMRLLSQNSIDPPCQRNTTTTWLIDNENILFTDVHRTSIEGSTQVTMTHQFPSSTRVHGNHPVYGEFDYVDSLNTYRITGGPNTSINLDMDIVANYHMLFMKLKPMEVGEADSLTSKKIELNAEEWGKRCITGDTWYKIKRRPDNAFGERNYEIIQPGFNGSSEFSFQSIITLGNDGIIKDIRFNNHVTAKRIVP